MSGKIKLLILITGFLAAACSLYAQSPSDSTVSNLEDSVYHVPNTNVRMQPPKEFKPFGPAHGFIHLGSASTIQVNEIEGTPWPVIVNGMTQEHFDSQEVELISGEEIDSEGKHGMMYLISYVVKETEFERIMYFTGDYNNTIWINANYPAIMRPLIYNAMRQSVLTAEFIPEDE